MSAPVLLAMAMIGVCPAAGATGLRPPRADTVLDRALRRFVAFRGGPPGVAVVVQRGEEVSLHTTGVADVATGAPPQFDDHMRLASVAKAFSGATALAVVADGELLLDTTIGDRLPSLPAAWSKVTLRQALNHTSGIPDFSQTSAFRDALLRPCSLRRPRSSSSGGPFSPRCELRHLFSGLRLHERG